MWFKNLTVLQFVKPFTHTQRQLEEALQEGTFVPCASFQAYSAGWVPPSRDHKPAFPLCASPSRARLTCGARAGRWPMRS